MESNWKNNDFINESKRMENPRGQIVRIVFHFVIIIFFSIDSK